MARSFGRQAIARFADMLAALGTEPRLRIVRLLLKPTRKVSSSAKLDRNSAFRRPPSPTISTS